MSSKRLLVIKLKQPGDVLVSTPVIAALKAGLAGLPPHLPGSQGHRRHGGRAPGAGRPDGGGPEGRDLEPGAAFRPGLAPAALRPGARTFRRRPGRHLFLAHRGEGAPRLCAPREPFWQRRALYPPAAPAAGQDAPGGPESGSRCGPWVSSPKTPGCSFFGIRPWKSVSGTCSPPMDWPPAASWSCTPGPAGASNAGPPRATPGLWRLCKMNGGCR